MHYSWLLVATLVANVPPAKPPPLPTYVSDRLSVSLRGANAPDAPVVKQIIGGAPVKVLARDGALLKIRTEDGSVGWLEPELVTTEKPLHILYLESTDNLAKAQETIKALQNPIATSTTPIRDESKIVAELRAEIKNTLEHAVALEKHIRENSTQAYEGSGRARALETEIEALKAELADRPNTTAVARETGSFFPKGTTPATPKFSVNLTWFVASLILMLLFGGALGWLVMAKRVRKSIDEFQDQP